MDARLHHLQGEAAVVAATAGTGARPTAIALGSNQGDRAAHLEYAIERVKRWLDDVRVAPFIETEPVDVAPQPRFLNGVVVGRCAVSPAVLMAELRRIEHARARTRPYRGAPRTLDLDLIVMGALVIDEPDLQLPHPRFRRRRFVLEPLVAVAPELVDPVTGLTMHELLDALGTDG